MKKKRFYNNKNRNQKWTEEETGRRIDFADKYISGENYSDKFDSKRPNPQNTAKKKEQKQKRLKNFIVFVMCIVLICIGYTGMDVYMTRHAVPAERLGKAETTNIGNMSEISIDISSYKVESVSLDASVMLSSVIDEASSNGYSSITFDAKRSDGTIGYVSSLASVDTFSSISSPASQPEASVKELLANDILPVARICCYLDNVVPAQATDAAITNSNTVYTDSNGNTYLNPNSSTAYNYIKDIIQECYNYGITVFVLYGCDLPDAISDNYNDGFEYIANKLNADLEGNIKIFEEIDVNISGKDSETGKITNSAIKNEIKQFDKINSNQVYFISSKIDSKRLSDQLDKASITNYIIED